MQKKDLIERAQDITLLALDVDGIMTDGKLYFSAQGDEIKGFNILDGLGIKHLINNGIEVAIITGRNSPLTARRARDLGIEHILQGREDKKTALMEILDELNIGPEQCAYMGDDLPDLGAIIYAGLGFTVPNAHNFVKEHADYCTSKEGGNGAVRELSDLLLEAQNKLKNIHSSYMS